MAILVTGSAGFIGAYVSQALLKRGETVLGVDNLNDYYSPALKQDRLKILENYKKFEFVKLDLADRYGLYKLFKKHDITHVIHLAAQAGVRYSLINPTAYLNSNLIAHSHILEAVKDHGVKKLVYASSSSVYGGNKKIPFSETDATDQPVSFYAATKKSNEAMSYAYAKLYGIPTMGLRFFTVYGPWGRPDMAYWGFAQKIKQGHPIHIFNQGHMSRDFTYIDDIALGVLSALDYDFSELTLDVPHRLYNLGNDRPEKLMDMIKYLEKSLGEEAKKIYEPMQPGDVPTTWADISRARKELNYAPQMSLKAGLENFIEWYQTHWEKYI